MTKVLPNLFHLMEFGFSNAIATGIKELLEQKHLYQNLVVSFPPFDVIYKNVSRIENIESIQPNVLKECQLNYNSAQEFGWRVPSPIEARRLPFYNSNAPERTIATIDFTPPTIKTFCPICKSLQPYNYVHGIELSKDFIDINQIENPVEVQIFALAFECQSCKSFPEVFMIRREKMKLILSGRTPIEQVDIPKFIPKPQRKFFSDAIIAYNSGQILAGKFLLRTFIEQYVRDFTNDKTSQNTDELFEKYGASLHDDFKKHFPSLSSIYSRLSIDIHEANQLPEPFIQARKDIEKHFEAKKLFESP